MGMGPGWSKNTHGLPMSHTTETQPLRKNERNPQQLLQLKPRLSQKGLKRRAVALVVEFRQLISMN